MPTSPGPLLEALSELWERLRDQVADLPPALFTVSPTTRRNDHGPARWTREDDGAVSGLVVSADVLQEGAESVVEMVLHDAAHILNWIRDVKDTTTRGAYHTQAFLTTAEEVGLEWSDGAERTATRGFSNPVMSTEARERYAADVEALEGVIPLTLPHLALPPTTARTDRLTLQCQCNPPRKLRISRTVAAQGPIKCGVCDATFEEI